MQWKQVVAAAFGEGFVNCDLFDHRRRLEVTYQLPGVPKIWTIGVWSEKHGPGGSVERLTIEPADIALLKKLGARASYLARVNASN